VIDCGVGVAAENADQLFSAFFTTKSGFDWKTFAGLGRKSYGNQ